jgi:murein DD-endopeptidase MepM/ murein hydrolase activator NlpD
MSPLSLNSVKPNMTTEVEDFILPLDEGYEITSEYGERIHPISGEISFHSGIDMAGEHLGNIYAVAGGEVTYAGVQSGYGNCVEIKHEVNGETVYSFYAHLAEIDVEVGDIVSQGDVIGLQGGAATDPNPGTSTGTHLHFEMWDGPPYAPGAYYFDARSFY